MDVFTLCYDILRLKWKFSSRNNRKLKKWTKKQTFLAFRFLTPFNVKHHTPVVMCHKNYYNTENILICSIIQAKLHLIAILTC